MSHFAKPRRPEPLPGTPEALAREQERARILAEAHGQRQALVPVSTQAIVPEVVEATALAVPQTPSLQVRLKEFPELPPSDRLKVIPKAQPVKYKDPKLGYDMDALPPATGNKPDICVKHTFSSSANSPDWLNNPGGSSAECIVCGVTIRKDLIRPDRKGMNFHYVDAYGLQLSSMIELDCPVFIGDTNGAIGEAKQRVRGHDVILETVDARLNRLEQHNQYLQEQLEAKIQLDVNGLVAWLSQVSQMSAQAQLPTTQVAIAGLPFEIPTPIAELVRGVGETITVKAIREGEDDDDDY